MGNIITKKDMRNKNLAKEKRGFTTESENRLFAHRLDDELILLLKSDNPKERTSAAVILGKRKSEKAITALCEQLKNERALYSKIAIAEALGKTGKPAIYELIKCLGEIGTNQHKNLPDQLFNKWSYPLPRDIVARTICKMGDGVLEELYKVLAHEDKRQISEAIDVIGFISFYSKNKVSLEVLITALEEYGNDEIIKWKIIRALSAFPGVRSEKILLDILTTEKRPELRWEAVRSLGLICENVPQELSQARNDSNENVRKMAGLAIEKIGDKK